MIDLSADPPREPAGPRLARRQLLLAAACGLAGGAGGAWATVRLAAPRGPSPVASSVAALEPAEAQGTFVDLATVGPAVTVAIGRSGRCSVTVGATIAYGSTDNGVLSQGGAVSFETTGANRRQPSLDRAGQSFLSLSGVDVPFSVTQSFASTTVLDGLRPGRTTFTAKYLVEGGSPVPVFFRDRTIVVVPLAAAAR